MKVTPMSRFFVNEYHHNKIQFLHITKFLHITWRQEKGLWAGNQGAWVQSLLWASH